MLPGEPTPLAHLPAGPLPRLLHHPTVSTFCGLACGFWAQPGLHTLTGMLIGARLERTWHHARAHRFFSHARWSADQLGVCLLDLIVVLLVPDGVPVRLVCDETLASIPATAQPSAIASPGRRGRGRSRSSTPSGWSTPRVPGPDDLAA
jgi:DDE superfamily endonuclease